MKRLLCITASAFLLAACNQQTKPPTYMPDILLTNMDTTVNPGTDFFDYAEGGWIKKNPIPADEAVWGIGKLVREELYARLKFINEQAAKKQATGGIEQQIGDFWYAGMDSAGVEKNGIEPLKDELAKIGAVKTPAEAMAQAARMQIYGAGVFFAATVLQDPKQSDVNSFILWQGGLGLPNRDYYFNKDSMTARIRNQYPKYIARIFGLMGADSVSANKKAAGILALETKLATASRKLEDLRDPYANYHKMAIADLHKISPLIDWPGILKTIGVHSVDSVIVGQPEFYQALDKVVNTENIETLKDYMAYNLVNAYAPYLSTPFVQANFDFYDKLITGSTEMHPRWKRVLDAEEGAIGEEVGQLFAKEYFNEKAKKRYSDMVENVRNAYKARIGKLTWMSDSTKQKAQAKLSAIRKKVGYPDKWKDFSKLHVTRQSYALNMMQAHIWWNDYELSKLGKPVDRDEWTMTPQTYNAYYNPGNNEIVLPAGMFTVPGYRDEELDEPMVYGYTAASTIGHEITHGFDDEGRQFDEKGNLRNWWTKEDEKQFNARAAVLAGQFNKMVVVDTLHINGKATLGENLADLGGILIGLDAFKQTEAYKKGEKLHGLTPLQRFFLGYALGWMYEVRPENLARMLLTDVHSPEKYRVNGPFPNVNEFYEAFNIKPGDKMYLADSLRVRLW